MNGANFLRGVTQVFPYKIHTVLTDNAMAFADLPKNRNKPIHAFLKFTFLAGSAMKTILLTSL